MPPVSSPIADELQADALERFLRYVRIDTQSARESETYPSTLKQLELSRLLESELREIGLEDVELAEHGYVLATLPGVEGGSTVGLFAHVDTAPDASGTNVNPQVHADYDGGQLVAGLSPATSPLLDERLGHDIVTADGTTLLGADDKAGVAEIMAAADYLAAHPEIPHARARICFTVDEEVGHGVDHLDLERFGADFAYTLDGEKVGEIENETWSALELKVTFHGVPVHPGIGKGKLVNPVKLAARFVESLPKDTLSPETTEGREGFVHPLEIAGDATSATVTVYARDFDWSGVLEKERLRATSPSRRARASPSSAGSSTATCARRSTRRRTSSRRRSRRPAASASSRASARSAAAPTARASPSWACRPRTSSPAETSTTRCASGSAHRTWRSRPRRSSSC
jgi:tripeptide aminopeptidase